MNQKTLIATLVGAIVMFLLGWLIYGLLLMNYFEANTKHYEGLMKEMPNLFLIALSNLLYSFLLAYIFYKWAGYKTFVKGLTGGLIIGFLVIFSFDLYFLAAMHLFNMQVVIVDIIVYTIFSGITGGVIAWVLGYGKKAVVV